MRWGDIFSLLLKANREAWNPGAVGSYLTIIREVIMKGKLPQRRSSTALVTLASAGTSWS